MIKAIDVTHKIQIPERFNLFEYLENDNEFIKCKSKNNQTGEFEKKMLKGNQSTYKDLVLFQVKDGN